MKKNNEKGFTLVEIAAVIAILSILSVIIVPNVLGMLDNGNASVYKTKASTIEEVLSIGYEELGKFDTKGEANVSDNVESQIKHTLSDLGVRYVDKAWEEIKDNGLIKEVNQTFLYTNPYRAIDRDNLNEYKWLVIDHVDTVGEENFIYYRNELFGKVLNDVVISFGDNHIVGTLGEFQGEWNFPYIEEITPSSIRVLGVNPNNRVRLYKENSLIGEIVGNGTLNYSVENDVVEYKLELLDNSERIIDRKVVKGIPKIENLIPADIKLKPTSTEGYWEVTWNNSFCLSSGSDICLSSDEMTIQTVDYMIIEGNWVYGYENRWVINMDSIGDALDIRAYINGNYTETLKIEMNR